MTTVNDLIQQTIETGNLDEPFYVVDIEDIIKKHQNWLVKMAGIKPFYAVKCNNSPVVLEMIAALGIGFDCASKAEIEAVLRIGVSPTNIIYANPCKSKSNIDYASKANVDLMTFDNEEELYKISEIAPNSKLVVRIKADDSHSKYHLGRKFGIDMKNVKSLLELAKHLELSIVGVSFHVGSDCSSNEPYNKAIRDARRVFELGKELGFEMNILDIGGGFPGNDDDNDRSLFDQIANTINKALTKYFPPEMDVTIIAEPGRYYVASSFTLTTMIIAKRKEVVNDEEEQMMYYINDGLYGSFSNTTFGDDEVVPLPQIKDNPYIKRKTYPSVIWGPTCDALDCIRTKVYLPEMKVGEWMTFKDMGAYTSALATRFNGFPFAIIKCHATPVAIEYMRNLSTWPRLVQLLCLKETLSINSLVGNIWDFIHVHN